MRAVCQCGGEDIGIAALAYLQAATQVVDGGREVTQRYVGLRMLLPQPPQRLLAEIAYLTDDKGAGSSSRASATKWLLFGCSFTRP